MMAIRIKITEKEVTGVIFSILAVSAFLESQVFFAILPVDWLNVTAYVSIHIGQFYCLLTAWEAWKKDRVGIAFTGFSVGGFISIYSVILSIAYIYHFLRTEGFIS